MAANAAVNGEDRYSVKKWSDRRPRTLVGLYDYHISRHNHNLAHVEEDMQAFLKYFVANANVHS